MISTSFAVLHASQSVPFAEYLVRVFVYLLFFSGIGVTMYWAVRVIELVQSEISGRGETNDADP